MAMMTQTPGTILCATCLVAMALAFGPIRAHGDTFVKNGIVIHDGAVNPGPWRSYDNVIITPNVLDNRTYTDPGLSQDEHGNLVPMSDFYKTFDTSHDGIISSSEYLRGLNRNNMQRPDGGIMVPPGAARPMESPDVPTQAPVVPH
jgi:hypothetical protein